MGKLKQLLVISVSFGAGFAVANKIMKDKYEAIVQEEIESIYEVRNREKTKEDDISEDDDGDDTHVKAPESEPRDDKYAEMMDNLDYGTADKRFQYTKPPLEELVKKLDDFPHDDDIPKDIDEQDDYEQNDFSEGDEEEMGIVPMAPKEKSDVPYVISVQDFNEHYDEYDKLSLTYYAQDDILTDERDELVDDVAYVVGMDALENFGYLSEDPDVVYVRNDHISSDIEIVRVDGSYVDIVIGE